MEHSFEWNEDDVCLLPELFVLGFYEALKHLRPPLFKVSYLFFEVGEEEVRISWASQSSNLDIQSEHGKQTQDFCVLLTANWVFTWEITSPFLRWLSVSRG